jgi:c-di-GMP-related signal transduction protein
MARPAGEIRQWSLKGFIGRDPFVDRKHELLAYELRFRRISSPRRAW